MKIKAIILAVLACVLVLSGCGNKANTGSNAEVSEEVITDTEIDEAVNPEDAEPEEIVPLSTKFVLPENINTEDLVDTEDETKATVTGTTKEATEKYIQTLVGAGYNLDYKFESQNAAQYSLSTNEVTVSVMLKNDEMLIYASKFE